MVGRRLLTAQESKRLVRKSIRRDSRPVSKVEALAIVKRAMEANYITAQTYCELMVWERKLKVWILQDKIARRELAK